jgi:hypothetical protein
MLSRLAFKVQLQDHGRTFPLLLKLNENPSVWSDITLRDSCALWFERLFDAVDGDLLAKWLPDLIRSPLFVIATADGWHDPIWRLPKFWDREVNKRPELLAKITEAIDWLLKRFETESDEARYTAILRLIYIYYCRVMTPDQERRVAGLIWRDSTGDNLPGLANLTPHQFLHLPGPANRDVQSAVKKHILALPTDGVVSQDATGKTTISSQLGWEQPLIREATLATKPIIKVMDMASTGVEWTPAESKQLYLKARAWWLMDKHAFEIVKPGEPFNLLDSVLKTLGRLDEFLAFVVIPAMQEANEAEWQELIEWLQEVRSVGGFPTVALPYILLHRPAETASVAETIATDINSDIEDAVRAAAKANRHWVHLSAMGRVSTPPQTLMAALIERVTLRRKSGIVPCLAQLSYLIVEKPEVLTQTDARLLTASLIPWHQATILPVVDEPAGDFPEAERPNLRAFVGQLAGALKIWYAKSAPGVPIPAPITAWENFCATDSLPEVRRAFNSWGDAGLQSV